MSAEDAVESVVDLEGTFGIAAVPADAKALAPPGERYTKFSGVLINVLDTGLSGGGETITLSQLFEAVRVRINREGSMPLPQKENWQEGASFRFARNRFVSGGGSSAIIERLNLIAEAVEGQRTTIKRLENTLEELGVNEGSSRASDSLGGSKEIGAWARIGAARSVWIKWPVGVRTGVIAYLRARLISIYLLLFLGSVFALRSFVAVLAVDLQIALGPPFTIAMIVAFAGLLASLKRRIPRSEPASTPSLDEDETWLANDDVVMAINTRLLYVFGLPILQWACWVGLALTGTYLVAFGVTDLVELVLSTRSMLT
jgi:hypothetical protein